MSDTKFDDAAERRLGVHFRVVDRTLATGAGTRRALAARPGSDLFCDNCNQRQMAPRTLRSAENFCTHCDFPLFYSERLRRDDCVRPVVNKRVARRSPGVRGYQAVSPLPCRVCGEGNHHPSEEDQSEARCHRDNELLFEPTALLIAPADWDAPTTDDQRAAIDTRTSWRRSVTSWWHRTTAWLRTWWLPIIAVVAVAAIIVAALVWRF